MGFYSYCTDKTKHSVTCHTTDDPCDEQSCRAEVLRRQVECNLLDATQIGNPEITEFGGVRFNVPGLMRELRLLHQHLLEADGPAVFHTPYYQNRPYRASDVRSRTHIEQCCGLASCRCGRCL